MNLSLAMVNPCSRDDSAQVLKELMLSGDQSAVQCGLEGPDEFLLGMRFDNIPRRSCLQGFFQDIARMAISLKIPATGDF
jgi:hypothetical protein